MQSEQFVFGRLDEAAGVRRIDVARCPIGDVCSCRFLTKCCANDFGHDRFQCGAMSKAEGIRFAE